MQVFYGRIAAALRFGGRGLNRFGSFDGQTITAQHIKPPLFACRVEVNRRAFYCCQLGSRLGFEMIRAAALLLVVVVSACEVFRGGAARPRTAQSEREFVDVYVALSKAQTPEAKRQVLIQHGTSEKELEAFMRAYAANLPALSAVFDSIVARQGMQTEAPVLP
jgi:hypothetical protein